jgi:hypothetical protein
MKKMRCLHLSFVVFDRACGPFVLRRKTDDLEKSKFELLDEAYVHGIMKGEVMQMDDFELQDITLV